MDRKTKAYLQRAMVRGKEIIKHASSAAQTEISKLNIQKTRETRNTVENTSREVKPFLWKTKIEGKCRSLGIKLSTDKVRPCPLKNN